LAEEGKKGRPMDLLEGVLKTCLNSFTQLRF
jgi:hypothetical protein